MWKLRYYWPLIAFILPSAAIGYGVVLPRSGASGWNALTIGFAGSLAGAAVAYAMGVAAAARTSCPRARPWRVRLNQVINRQASNPHGLFGRFLGWIWKREHREINEVTLDLLEAARQSRLLEVGCGPGEALREAARRGCSILGLDVSPTMVSLARKRNRKSPGEGDVAVRLIRDGELDLEPGAFDGAFSVHCVYFWKSPERTLCQLAAALKPGRRLVLAFMPGSPLVPARFRDEAYRFYRPEEMKTLLSNAGFTDVQTVSRRDVSENAIWMIAAKA